MFLWFRSWNLLHDGDECKEGAKSLGITDVEVDHTTIDDIVPGAADLFICGADLLPNAEKQGKQLDLITWFQWMR